MRSFFPALFFLMLFLVPQSVFAAADLRIRGEDIFFPTQTLLAGDTLRMYARVENVGDVDVSGYVLFYQGSVPVGESQPISVRANSLAEEVYVDFTVPATSFNIRAEIAGTLPQDANADNNSAVSSTFTPVLDDDRDGIANTEDTCPLVSNTNQLDTDGDGAGDACDPDDDGDALSDTEEVPLGLNPLSFDSDGDTLSDGSEVQQGSNPLSRDSDRDGLPDGADLRPTIDDRPSATPPSREAPRTQPVAAPVVSGQSSSTPAGDSRSLPVTSETNPTLSDAEPPAPDASDPAPFPVFSPKALFRYQEVSRGQYHFEAQVPDLPGWRLTWDFGDGFSSTDREVTHSYEGFGDRTVTLRVVSDAGILAEENTTLHIPFLTFENYLVQLFVGMMGLIFLLAIVAYFFARRRASFS